MKRWLSLVAAWVITLAALEAPAEQGERELALQLGREGVELYNEQRYEDALDRFQNAESLVHSPVFVLYMARIERKRGRLLQALEHYDRLLAEMLPSDAAEPWLRAQREGQLERGRLMAELATIRVETDAPEARVSVWIDGRPVPNWQKPFAVIPGRHQLVAQHEARSRQAQVSVKAGQHDVVVTLDFPPPPARSGPSAPEPRRPVWATGDTPPPIDDAPMSSHETAGYALLAAGGAAALGFFGVSIAAFVQNRRIESQCLERVCPEALEEDLVQLERLRFATLGLGLGAAALSISGWIVVGTAPSEGVAPSARVQLGPGMADLRVRF